MNEPKFEYKSFSLEKRLRLLNQLAPRYDFTTAKSGVYSLTKGRSFPLRGATFSVTPLKRKKWNKLLAAVNKYWTKAKSWFFFTFNITSKLTTRQKALKAFNRTYSRSQRIS